MMKPSLNLLLAGLAISAALPASAQEGADYPTPATEPKVFRSVALSQPDLYEYLPVGRTETVYERFPSGEVKIERQVTLDDSSNYVNHGPWKMFDRQGAIIAEGEYDMGQRSGVWTKVHNRSNAPAVDSFPFNRFQAPFLSTASYKGGVMDGHWLIVDKQERKVMQITLEKGQRHGMLIMWLPNGEVARQANYERGLPVGDVLVMKKPGEELDREATFVNGHKVTSKVAQFRRGGQKRIEEMFLAPKTAQKSADSFWDMRFAEYEQSGEEMRHGPSREWHPNGQLKREGQYASGKRTGRFTYWHPNGQKLAEGSFQDDQQHGRWVWWHDNGLTSAIGEYRSGQQVGNWLWWEQDGRLIRQGIAESAPAELDTRSAGKQPKPIR